MIPKTPMPMYLLTKKSENHKTGLMAVSTSPKQTCSTACPFKDNGCYAATGPLALWWNRCSENTDDPKASWKAFCAKISALPAGTVFRHNQAGDLVPKAGSKHELDGKAAMLLASSCKEAEVSGFTYTHYPVLAADCEGLSPKLRLKAIRNNRLVVEKMNRAGFTVNVSTNSLSHADAVIDSGIDAPVVVVLPGDVKAKSLKTPKGRKVLVCPQAWNKETTCSSCKICLHAGRKAIIGFPSHGCRKKRCDEVYKEHEVKYGQSI
jgi:hypothetical protein